MNSQQSILTGVTAANAISKGVSLNISRQVDGLYSLQPLPTAAPHRTMVHLIGLRRGRLVCLGASAHHKKRYVVRCDCGAYTIRTARALSNESNDQDRCGKCRAIAQAKRDYAYHVLGIDLDIRTL
jgi:hypothetical protein